MQTIPPVKIGRRESGVQSRMLEQFKKRGCMAEKLVSQSTNGWPDTIVITPEGRVMFIEVKDDGGTPSPVQQRRLKQLADHNTTAILVYAMHGVYRLIVDYDYNQIPTGYVEYK